MRGGECVMDITFGVMCGERGMGGTLKVKDVKRGRERSGVHSSYLRALLRCIRPVTCAARPSRSFFASFNNSLPRISSTLRRLLLLQDRACRGEGRGRFWLRAADDDPQSFRVVCRCDQLLSLHYYSAWRQPSHSAHPSFVPLTHDLPSRSMTGSGESDGWAMTTSRPLTLFAFSIKSYMYFWTRVLVVFGVHQFSFP